MATVKLFGGLRRYVEAPEFEIGGATVREVLDELCAGNEALREAILDESIPDKPELRPHVRVMVAGRDIELDQGLETPLDANDQVAIFPPIAGGGQERP